MQVGIIAPVSSLERYCTTEIQYCLPYLILGDEAYREFYKQRLEEGNLVIMDTRDRQWKRYPEEPEVILKALKYLTPSLIITPSYMYNLKRTLEDLMSFLRIVKPKSIAGCVEGTSEDEVDTCIKMYSDIGIKTFAIPAHLYNIKKDIPHNGPTIYLDNWVNHEELDGLEGTLVTSFPVRLGLQGRLNSDYLPAPPSLTFYEEDNFPKVVERNIKEVIEFYEHNFE